MQLFHLHARRRRARGAILVLLLGLGWLGIAFFQTQVLKTSAYALQSEANRLRPLTVPAARGTIFDRYGEIVADNVPGYTLSLLPAPRDSIRASLVRLGPVLGLSAERIDALMSRQRESPNQPLLVSGDLTFDQVSAIEERRVAYPGVLIEMQPKRHYPAGDAIAHLVGYVAEISRNELELPEFASYAPGRMIGKTGLERQYEAVLGGGPGLRYVEVDALGRIVGEFSPRNKVEPVPGSDVNLNLDLGLQRWIARIFPDTMRGSVVAIEPGTGHVLALFSRPAFDPNRFVGGVAPELWRSLNADPAAPLLNRATHGLYPPGSTFKMLTAAIALELNVLRPDEYMPIQCRGGMQYGNRYFRCWYRQGHGALTLADALKNSCNVYFYQVGVRIGLDRFLREATRLGFSNRTGIDLPTEGAGVFPDDPEWYRRRFGWRPTPSEVLSLSIGQGPNDQTPLKMAQFAAALAGDGRIAVPSLRADDAPAGEATLDLHLEPEHLEMIREGMRRATRPGGTAYLASLEHWELLGKTGTSQNPHGRDHGWFVGMAGPRDGELEIALAVIVEFGESGSVAAQYAGKAADYYLRRKYGMPVDSIQTLRDHYLANRRAPWAGR